MYIDQKDPPTLSEDQPTVHNHIYKFYNALLSRNECNEDFPALEDFLKDIDLKKSPTKTMLN